MAMKSRRRLYVYSVIFAASLFGFQNSSLGASDDAKLAESFRGADLNDDGHLNIDEYTRFMVHLFAHLDTDRDGFLALADIPGASKDRFSKADMNDDQKLSLGEGVGIKVVDFFDADTNNDGVMSLQELIAFERQQ